jgi:hypothetical protein
MPDDLKRTAVPLPISGNATGGLTAVVRQYAPNNFDGHFVVFRDADAKVNTDRFLADAVNGGVPLYS